MRSTGRLNVVALLWGTILGLTMRAHAVGADLLISEILASNGDQSDWLELHNTGGTGVDLGGLTLTDDEAVPNKWTLPSLTLPANNYIVVFCSSKDRTDPGGALHTNFALKAGKKC